ncbi:MAG TPA: MJ0042-type zinc finger domain-containing protein [Isosphaeraceae bacterium]|nr:MJ0042-type zinc finger domain-containing protein [Isosphaeraceae bacterium]
MKIRFACPSCAAVGSVDASAAGKLARCKQCGQRFTLPSADPAEPEVYSLEEPAEGTIGVGDVVKRPAPGSTFVPARGDEPAATMPRKSKRSAPRSTARTADNREPRFAWRGWLTSVGVAAAIAIAAIALLAPRGVLIAACMLMAIGGVMILVGYGVGAYGAFQEDFLYGFLYLVIPLYTAYYAITRWDDLWIWLACMTMGVGLIKLGIEMARWGGVAV